MTAKEKARELVNKYLNMEFGIISKYMPEPLDIVKQCALIAVDEVISNIEPSVSMDVISARIKYWGQVKKEIEKL